MPPGAPGPYSLRRQRAAGLLREAGLDALLLTPGSDLAYLTGYRVFESERITCLVLHREGSATLVIPELEAPRAAVSAPDLPVAMWGETDDPYALIASYLSGRAGLAAADRMWGAFLLQLQARLPGRPFSPASRVTRGLRMRKDPGEIGSLREAARAADRAFAQVLRVAFAGRKESDVAADLAALLREEGHDDVLFTIVASGPNGASPHHETGDRRIAAGDAVVLDFGGTRGHYCSDITRTVHVGTAHDAEVRRVHEIVRRAQEAGYRAARSGATAESVDHSARQVIADAGYGDHFIHRLGHGIGLDGHEEPYLVSGNAETLEPGMAFSIEPGIYLPGKFGVRIEDIAIIGADGRSEPLNEADRALAIVA